MTWHCSSCTYWTSLKHVDNTVDHPCLCVCTDFPDAWHGKRVEGYWDESTCGGNTTRSTWINNPHFELQLETRCHVFISLSQEDPRGKENVKIIPIGFHICSLTPAADKSGKYEIKEPPGKPDVYYRLYKEKDQVEFKKGIRPETLPPATIPGSSIAGIDNDGTPQPAYTFKQAVSVRDLYGTTTTPTSHDW